MIKERQDKLIELITTYGALELDQGLKAGRGKPEEFKEAMNQTDKAFQDLIKFIIVEC